jgi:hypothetical protein
MGGIQEMTLGVVCDRCKERRAVEDDDSIAFYKAWATRENKDDRMFVAILNSPDGNASVDTDYEWLCPKCVRVVHNNLAKIDTDLVAKDEPKDDPKDKPKDGPKDKPKSPPKPKDPPADPPPPEDPPTEETRVEEPPPEEPESGEPDGEPGVDYADNDLFDD